MKQLEVYRVSRALFKCWAELRPDECQAVDEDNYIIFLKALTNYSINIYSLDSNAWNDVDEAISFIATEKGITIEDDTEDEDEWWNIYITQETYTYRGDHQGRIPFMGLAKLDCYIHWLSNQVEA